MKKLFVPFSISQIRKHEVPALTYAVLEIVEKYHPSTLRISGVYNLLKKHETKLGAFACVHDGYPLRAELVDLRLSRKKLLSSILAQIWSIEHVDLPAYAEPANLVLPFLTSYLKGTTGFNENAKTGRIKQLQTALEANEELKEALGKLGFLSVYMDELMACQRKIDAEDTLRRKTVKNNIEANKKQAKERVTDAIKDLLSYIELASVIHTDLDYMPLVLELNVLLTEKQALIKSRITRSKNNKISAEKLSLNCEEDDLNDEDDGCLHYQLHHTV